MGGIRARGRNPQLRRRRPTRPAIIDNVREYDPDLAQKILDEMFVFENLLEIDDRGIQLLLREVQSDALIIALKGASPAARKGLQEHVAARRRNAARRPRIEGPGAPVRSRERAEGNPQSRAPPCRRRADPARRRRRRRRRDGEVTGRTLAETLIREQAESFALLVSQLDQDISALGHSVADELLALAMEIARKMVGHTLAVKPEVVVEIVQQALAQLPVQHVTIALHPEDASLARQYAGEILAHAGHRIHESPKLKRGDVLLDAGGSHLDATLATRWQRALDGLGPVSNWDSLPAAHHEPADKEPPLRAETSVKPEALVEPVEPAAPVIAAEAAESDEPAKP
jgi:flagellar assembly protein FliH